MGIGNHLVGAVLRSPLHGMLDGSYDVVRYQGRQSGRTFITPTQFARHDDGIVVFVGHPAEKSWWRNFRGGHELDVLLGGQWVPMLGTALIGAESPEAVSPLLSAYLERFPRLARHLPEGATDVGAVVVVWCRPRPPNARQPD